VRWAYGLQAVQSGGGRPPLVSRTTRLYRWLRVALKDQRELGERLGATIEPAAGHEVFLTDPTSMSVRRSTLSSRVLRTG
jgi:hypothetical protein